MNRAKEIMKQAQRNDPANAQKAKYTDRVKTPNQPKVNVPDFVTQARK